MSSCGERRVLASSEIEIGAENDTAWSMAMRKYGTSFNRYRKTNGLPMLPGDFYLYKSGGDYVEWKSPREEYPGFDSKIIVWVASGTKEPFLVWENNLFNGMNGEILSFRYGRKNADSLIENYSTLDPLYTRETDTLYWRSYRFFEKQGKEARILRKDQYDSVLHAWGIRLSP